MPERKPQKIAAAIALVFGVATLVSGGRALFGGADMGAVVPFVLRFNFAAGGGYLLAGAGLWRGAAWARWLALAICAATALVGAALLVHIGRGGAYEPRTLGAMALRTGVWAALAFAAFRAPRA